MNMEMTLKTLIKAMPQRMHAVIKAKVGKEEEEENISVIFYFSWQLFFGPAGNN